MFHWMGIAWRPLAIFATGAVVGALAGGGAATLVRDLPSRPTAAQTKAKPASAHAAAATEAATCPDTLALAPASREDGKFELVDSIEGKRPTDIPALIVIGKEAAAAGRA